MNKNQKQLNGVVVYQGKNGAIELKGDYTHETIWATQAQIARLFDVTPQNITLHLKNIFEDKELDKKATCKQSLQVQTEGKRIIKRTIAYYNLDAMIAVGYRINSVVGTSFRQWATKILRAHITKGYTLNPKVIKNNYTEFQKAIKNIRQLLPASGGVDHESVLELISAFANTWVSLDAYDRDMLVTKGTTKKSVALTANKLYGALTDFKIQLVKKGEATEIFGQEKHTESVAGIVGNVMQSFGGKPLYATLEEKAAHLLYFMVKNHPFTDGNKRSGAFAFIWYLKLSGLFEKSKITPPALTALTLFIAESDPKNKSKMIQLVLQLLR